MRSSSSAMEKRSPTTRPGPSRTIQRSSGSTWGKTMLKIRNLDAGYGNLAVLRRVSIHVKPGEIVTIIGANGAGKTTLLKTVTGLVRAQAGEVLFDNEDIGRAPTEKIVFRGCSLVPEGRQVFP